MILTARRIRSRSRQHDKRGDSPTSSRSAAGRAADRPLQRVVGLAPSLCEARAGIMPDGSACDRSSLQAQGPTVLALAPPMHWRRARPPRFESFGNPVRPTYKSCTASTLAHTGNPLPAAPCESRLSCAVPRRAASQPRQGRPERAARALARPKRGLPLPARKCRHAPSCSSSLLSNCRHHPMPRSARKSRSSGACSEAQTRAHSPSWRGSRSPMPELMVLGTSAPAKRSVSRPAETPCARPSRLGLAGRLSWRTACRPPR